MSEELEAAGALRKAVNTEAPLTRNIGAEVVTILVQIVLGIGTSVLIVRGLPQTPVYEFYIYILVFAWANLLVPVGSMGIDVALMKHIPEVVRGQTSSLYRIVGWACVVCLLASLGVVIVVNVLLVWLPPGTVVPTYVVPFFQLALFTVPLVALSMVLQGVFRGMQQMRYCAGAMGVFHGLFLAGLAYLFFTGMMTIFAVIIVNLAASVVTIAFEVVVLGRLLHQSGKASLGQDGCMSSRAVAGTALQAFLLTMLGALFVNGPLLIANLFRTSDAVFAGFGLAMGVAVYLHQGQAAPFRVLIPRVSGDVHAQAWDSLREYTHRGWKIGVVFAALVMVVVCFFAYPAMGVFFGPAGVMAAPFLVVLAGSFLVYTLTRMLMDTLIGFGMIRTVLVTYAAWNGLNITVLWMLSPLGGEWVAALIWVAGLPFLVLLMTVVKQRRVFQMTLPHLARLVGILLGISVISWSFVWTVGFVLGSWSLGGILAWLIQLGLLCILIPIAAFYLWIVIRTHILDAVDVQGLLQIISVVDPLSRPITWFIKRMHCDSCESSPS